MDLESSLILIIISNWPIHNKLKSANTALQDQAILRIVE